MASLDVKQDNLAKIIEEMGSLMVAFSGGVDSTYLLKVAYDVLGENLVGVTGTSPTYPEHELQEACSLAKSIGCRHLLVRSNELDIPGFVENSPRRCYYCKSELFTILMDKCKELGIENLADGTNCDDLTDYRPGKEAAEALGVRSPLIEAGMSKDDIRELSKRLGLPTWNKPAFACLSSRFPYGTRITEDRVGKVEACESLLRKLSFNQFRVRYHDNVARIEVGEDDFSKILSSDIRRQILTHFKEHGFKYVSLDMEGYRSGSMNEVVKNRDINANSIEINR